MYLTHLRTAPGGEKIKYFALRSMQADSLHVYGPIPVPNSFSVKMSLRHFVHVPIDMYVGMVSGPSVFFAFDFFIARSTSVWVTLDNFTAFIWSCVVEEESTKIQRVLLVENRLIHDAFSIIKFRREFMVQILSNNFSLPINVNSDYLHVDFELEK